MPIQAPSRTSTTNGDALAQLDQILLKLLTQRIVKSMSDHAHEAVR